MAKGKRGRRDSPVAQQKPATAQQDLQQQINELTGSNQDRQISHEGIQAINEELQAAHEELATSQEHMRTLNDQLAAVNQQLHDKVHELESANSALANLLNCTNVPTIFLDTRLRIKLYTLSAGQLYELIATDIGRPLAHLTPKFTDPDLIKDAAAVLQGGGPGEQEVQANDGKWYARRITPYYTADQRIDGVVVTFADVTEPKETTAATLASLATIVESSADAIFSRDLNGITRTWNPAAERLFGYRRDEAIGKPAIIVPPERAAEWQGFINKISQGESIEQVETERVRKDGSRVPVEVTVSPIRDSRDRVVGLSVITHDITRRKRDEQALRESEERFRYMADRAPVMIWIAGVDRLCTWVNEPWLDFTGRTMEQEMGNGWTESLHPDDFDRCMQTYASHFDARTSLSMEYRLRRQDGEFRWILDTGIPLIGPGADFHGYIGSCVDITHHKEIETALRDREARLTAVLNADTDAIITIDYQRIIQSANTGTEQMFGYSASELIGQNVSVLMGPPYREAHDGYLQRYRQTGIKHVVGVTRQVEARRKDGSIFPVELSVSEIPELQIFTGIHRDLTQRKQLERDVVEAASQEQHRIGRDLHDSVAQELAALRLMARDLAESLPADSLQAASLAGKMAEGLQRCQQELRSVLRGMAPVAVEANGLMAALADLCDRTQKPGKLCCTFECPNPISLTDNLTATHLYLIAQEAVYNAVRHAQAQQIRVSLLADGDLILRVQDDGIGIHSPLAETDGLGLRIMGNRAAIVGGRLSISTVVPHGTAVTCVLARNRYEQNKKARSRADRR
jgi:PAS domain S-box-containing protein